MKPTRFQTASVAGAFAIAGAILAFALGNQDTTVAGFKPRTVGIILLAAGVLVFVGVWLSSDQSGEPDPTTSGQNGNSGDVANVRIAGLIAVVAAIVGVCILATITLTHFGKTDKDSVVAITTSAFGIISAVVGAFLGIKTASDAHETAAKVVEAAQGGENASAKEVTSLRAAMGVKLTPDLHQEVLATAATIRSQT